jgi:hypothetical protein
MAAPCAMPPVRKRAPLRSTPPGTRPSRAVLPTAEITARLVAETSVRCGELAMGSEWLRVCKRGEPG